MTIDVIKEDGIPCRLEMEHCCFCANKTPYWCKAKDVAVCPICAELRDFDEVPSKAVWCASPQAQGVKPMMPSMAEVEGARRCYTTQLALLVTLDHGWDGYRAAPPRYDIMTKLVERVRAGVPSDFPVGTIVPLVDGGAQIEWHLKGADVELSIDVDGHESAEFENDQDLRFYASGDSDLSGSFAFALELLVRHWRSLPA